MAAQIAGARIALVTGANKGIGYEIARALLEQGSVVLLGCRDRNKGRSAAERLAAARGAGSAVALDLDVTRPSSIAAAARDIEAMYGRLDTLVNNAGISVEPRAPPSAVSLERVKQVYETNVFGVIAVTQAMLPLLRRSPAGRIVNMSSSMASLALISDPEAPWSKFGLLGYNTSKTALNALTVMFANELRESGIKVNAGCPGYVSTDINGHSGYRSAAQGAQIALTLANLPHDGATGGFFGDSGPIPW